MATPRMVLTPAQRHLRELASTIPALTRLPAVERFHATSALGKALDKALAAVRDEAVWEATRPERGGLTYRQAVTAGLARSVSMVNKMITQHKKAHTRASTADPAPREDPR